MTTPQAWGAGAGSGSARSGPAHGVAHTPGAPEPPFTPAVSETSCELGVYELHLCHLQVAKSAVLKARGSSTERPPAASKLKSKCRGPSHLVRITPGAGLASRHRPEPPLALRSLVQQLNHGGGRAGARTHGHESPFLPPERRPQTPGRDTGTATSHCLPAGLEQSRDSGSPGPNLGPRKRRCEEVAAPTVGWEDRRQEAPHDHRAAMPGAAATRLGGVDDAWACVLGATWTQLLPTTPTTHTPTGTLSCFTCPRQLQLPLHPSMRAQFRGAEFHKFFVSFIKIRTLTLNQCIIGKYVLPLSGLSLYFVDGLLCCAKPF